MENIYDVIIIGGGPAGLTAGLYATRSKLKTVLFEKMEIGGQIATTEEVANYPGSIFTGEEVRTTGPELAERMLKQAESFGLEVKMEGVESVDLKDKVKSITTENGEKYFSKTIIISTGASPMKLGIAKESEFVGRGVSYCSTCDAFFYRNLEVLCIGGGYAAAEEALYLTKFAKKVTMLIRRDRFSCAKSISDKVLENPKIEVLFNTELIDIISEEKDGVLTKAILKNNKTGKEFNFDSKDKGDFGIFIFVGHKPETNIFKDKLDLDESGYIITDEELKTNIEGVFAAGDLRIKKLRQIVTATSDGAIAATAAEKYLTE